MPRSGTKEEVKQKHAEYYIKNKERLASKMKEAYLKRKEEGRVKKPIFSEEKLILKKERERKWKEENRERYVEVRKAHYEGNKDKIILQTKEWGKRNKDKIAKIRKRYKATNKGKVTTNAGRNTRRKRAKEASIGNHWRKEILTIYRACSKLSIDTKEEFHVDHIVPLLGKEVCGLHVPWNLRIIPKLENMKKTNKIIQIYTK